MTEKLSLFLHIVVQGVCQRDWNNLNLFYSCTVLPGLYLHLSFIETIKHVLMLGLVKISGYFKRDKNLVRSLWMACDKYSAVSSKMKERHRLDFKVKVKLIEASENTAWTWSQSVHTSVLGRQAEEMVKELLG